MIRAVRCREHHSTPAHRGREHGLAEALTVQLDDSRADLARRLGLVLERRPLVARSEGSNQVAVLNGTGTFSGTVTDADTTHGIEGVLVNISYANGDWAAGVFTDGNGDYTSPALPPGDYLANTLDSSGYVNELYDDIPCYYYCHLPGGDLIPVATGSDNSGIDFQLEPGGTISGTVTDSDSKLGIEGVLVDLFDSDGNWLGNVGTDGSGNYASAGLLEGDYYAVTYNWKQYIDELYDDQYCPFGCDSTTGTTVAVVEGQVTPGIDFELEKGGSVTGNVEVDPAGPALENVAVEVWDSAGEYATTGWTNASGDYITERGLPKGDYHAKTWNDQGYVNELYDDKTCPGFCDVLTGDVIAVDEGVSTPGIDFALSSGGLISGSITAEGTGQQLADVWVDILDSTGKHVANGRTDSVGFYTIFASLAPGTYKAKTWNDLGYVNEIYDGESCPNWCDPSIGDDIVVAAGLTTAEIDFELALGGRISGTVTADGAGTPLEGVFVDLFTPAGEFISNPSSDSMGDYLSPALPAGTYYARTWNDQGYVNELYDNVPCFGCVLTSGTPIVLTAGTITEDIDIALGQGSQISGTVTQDGGGAPIEGIHVEIFGSSGQLLAWAGTDASGDYVINESFAAGLYYIKTWNDLGFINELYDGVPCAFCVATDGTPLVISAAETAYDVDFSLSRGGLISGTVTDHNTHAKLANIGVHVHDLSGNWIQSTGTDSNGDYLMKVGLPTGNYYSRTSNGQGYVNEVHSDVPCIGACEFDSATSIAVTQGSTTTGIDFALTKGAKVSGTVTDAGTGLPIDDSEVVIVTASGRVAAGARVRPDGTYTTWGAVPSGTYFVATRNHAGYLDELHSEKPCMGGGEFCDLTQGTPLLVVAGTDVTDIDFTLTLGGWFEGSVFDEAWARELGGTDVLIYDSSGDPVSKVTWRRPLLGDGKFKTCGLTPGTYYAHTDTSVLAQNYADVLFDDMVCAETCDPTLGTPISVVNQVGTTGIDFELRFRLFSDGFEAGDTNSWSAVIE